MGWSGNKLTRPYTKIAANGQGDLQRAFGVSSLTQSALFANGKINKFAKYKPFCNSSIYSDQYTDTNSQRLAGLRAANYGFGAGFVDGIPSFDSANALHSGFSSGWTYHRPTIGNYPLRADDCVGYVGEGGWNLAKYVDAAGNIVMSAPFAVDLMCKQTLGAGMLIYTGIAPGDAGSDGGLLTIPDFGGMNGFFPIASWYFGLAMISKTSVSNDRYWIGADALDHTISLAISVPTVGSGSNQIPADDYYIVPILCAAHTSDSWTSTLPGRCVTLDGWYHEVSVSGSATGFSWGISGSPYIESGVLKVNIHWTNTTGNAVTVNRLFTYSLADDTYENDTYEALVYACQYWVNNKAEYTGGVGVRVNNVGPVVAAYQQLASGLTIPAGYDQTIAYAVTTGSADALGHAYNGDTDVRLCIQYNTYNYLCDRIY